MSDTILSASNIQFGWGQNFLLRDFSIELKKGQILGLFGPNGSGKSTLLKILSGLIRLEKPSSGKIQFEEKDFSLFRSYERARAVAYIPSGIISEFSMTAREAVLLARICQTRGWLRALSSTDEDRVEWAMTQCQCWDLRDRVLGSLSGGERQLVALARGLAQGAKVLLLDEALSQMDLNHQIEMGRVLRGLAAQEYAIVLVSHDVNLALELSDHAIVIKRGEKVFEGRVQDPETSKSIAGLYPGAKLVIGKNPETGRPQLFFGG